MKHTQISDKTRHLVVKLMRVIVLILSLFLVLFITIDTFNDIPFYNNSHFMYIQFWICVLFLVDFFVELIMSRHKWSYFISHLLFFFVSIPWNYIFDYYGLIFSPQVEYLVRFIPLVRGGFALAIVVGGFTYNRAASLFITYLTTLIATVYFGSLVFYVFEVNVNPDVTTYGDAIWWAAMDATTVGSNIIAVTPVGKVLSVILAALGMMMFPIFTVYVTNLIQKHNHDISLLTVQSPPSGGNTPAPSPAESGKPSSSDDSSDTVSTSKSN